MKIRERVLRLSPICYLCEAKGQLTIAKEVDHIVPLIKGGTDDEAHLRGVCIDCHQEKTRQDMGWKDKPDIGIDGWPLS
jgi:5-methylcytosine-specific restriction protein A